MNQIDIRSNVDYPASALSNFASHPFVFDGVECATMEGLLQSLKFEEPRVQVKICKLKAPVANSLGRKRNLAWRQVQTLWWQGQPIARESDAYQALLDRAYQAMCEQSASFREALLATGDAVLTHSIGKSNQAQTVLTENELCSRLMRLRDTLRAVDISGRNMST
jgi:predicted NAD-dependent protein-ADP-ribosyltransferase YbiA (DUF1768 family)